MKKIENIKKEIIEFFLNAGKQHNDNGEIDKSKYFYLLTLVNELVLEDFSRAEYYNHFLKNWNQAERSTSRLIVHKSFENNYIDLHSYLTLTNELNSLVGWLR